MLRNSFFFTSIVFFTLLFPLYAAENDWVLAAEKFTTDQVPLVFENYASAIPYLLLGKLSSVSVRNVFPDELNARLLKELSEKKLLLVTERSKLILSRDMLLFSNEKPSVIKKKKKTLLLEIEKKESAILSIDLDISTVLQHPSTTLVTTPVLLWKDGNELFNSQDKTNKSSNLKKSGISALITGKIEDIAGYMCVTITIETGLIDFMIPSFTIASRYEDLEKTVDLLTLQLLPLLVNRDLIELRLSIKPEKSRLFIDDRLVNDHTNILSVYSGKHHIRCESPGFISAEKIYDFSKEKVYSVSIELKEKDLINVSFNTNLFPATVFFDENTIDVGDELFKTTNGSYIGEIINGDVSTWFVLDLPQGLSFQSISVNKNKVNSKTRIEGQRRFFYNSLGALYISLAPTLMLRGKSESMTRAYNNGNLEHTQEMVNSINSWITASMISQGISITLGINVFIQMVRYFIAVEQVIPEQAKKRIY